MLLSDGGSAGLKDSSKPDFCGSWTVGPIAALSSWLRRLRIGVKQHTIAKVYALELANHSLKLMISTEYSEVR